MPASSCLQWAYQLLQPMFVSLSLPLPLPLSLPLQPRQVPLPSPSMPAAAPMARWLLMLIVFCLGLQAVSLSVQRTSLIAHRHVNPVAGAAASSPVAESSTHLCASSFDWRGQFLIWLHGHGPGHFAVHQPAAVKTLDSASGHMAAASAQRCAHEHSHADLQHHAHDAADTTAVYVQAEDSASALDLMPAPKRGALDQDSLATRWTDTPGVATREPWPGPASLRVQSHVTLPLEHPPRG